MAASPRPRRPPGGKQERADRTRQAVIDETARYILEEGFVAPSVRRITERVGLTWGVVQYHFGDLDGLLMAVVEQGIGQLAEIVDHLPGRIAGLPARRRAQVVVDEVWAAFSSALSLAALEILISTRKTRARAMNAELTVLQERFTELGAHLGGGLDAAEATDIGNFVFTVLRGITVAQMVSPVPLDTSRDREVLVDVLTTHLLAQPHR